MKTNCINCGAPLNHLNQINGIIECDYCKTQYHVNPQTQMISEYIIEIEILGRKRKFYIENLIINNIYEDSYRNSRGVFVATQKVNKMKMNLIEM